MTNEQKDFINKYLEEVKGMMEDRWDYVHDEDIFCDALLIDHEKIKECLDYIDSCKIKE